MTLHAAKHCGSPEHRWTGNVPASQQTSKMVVRLHVPLDRIAAVPWPNVRRCEFAVAIEDFPGAVRSSCIGELGERLESRKEISRLDQIVRIQQQRRVPGGRRDATVAGCWRTLPRLAEQRDRAEFCLHDIRSSIGRAIIDDDDLEVDVRMVLRTQALEG